MIIKKFEKLNYTYDVSKDDFEIGKKDILNSIRELLDKYSDFTNDVSPSNWRTTGHHIAELNKMIEEIQRFSPISIQEKEIDWVKKNRFKNEGN